MKKIKLNVAKLQLNKEKITELTNERAGLVIGGTYYAVCADYTKFCDVIIQTGTSIYCVPTGPVGDTGCEDCTVCPRPGVDH